MTNTETICRALCAANNINPDELIYDSNATLTNYQSPHWTQFQSFVTNTLIVINTKTS